MTRTLDAAIAKLAELPDEEQDRIAQWLLDELLDEDHWACRFVESQEALSKLAAEALVADRRGDPEVEVRWEEGCEGTLAAPRETPTSAAVVAPPPVGGALPDISSTSPFRLVPSPPVLPKPNR
jgi:hypothetical protein